MAVTGRFQPFHRGHLELVRMAASWSDRMIGDGVVADPSAELWIGITNPDQRSQQEHPDSAHRHLPEANPFTYWQRQRMIAAALRGECPDLRVVIVPFPLDAPETWFDYIPRDAQQFVRSFTPWERSKAQALRAGGYEVTEIEGDPNTVVRASAIRSRWHDPSTVSADLPEPIAREVHRMVDSGAIAGLGAVR